MSQPLDPRGRDGRRLSSRATALFAAGWLLALSANHGARLIGAPLDRLYFPQWTAARLIDRDMEVAEALAPLAAAPAGAAFAGLIATPQETLDAAIEIQAELTAYAPGRDGTVAVDDAVTRWSLLLAESGRLDEALEVARRPDAPPDLPRLLELRYNAGPSADRAPSEVALPASALRVEGGGWLARRLDAPAPGTASTPDAAALARGRAAWWMLSLTLLLTMLALCCTAVIAGRWLRGARPETALDPPPWTLSDGLAVWVRGDFWAQLYFLGLGRLPEGVLPAPIVDVLVGGATLLAALPLAWLVWRHLLRPASRPGRPADPFGLGALAGGPPPTARRAAQLGGLALAALAIDLAGTWALDWAAWASGLSGHWSEGLDETLVWASAGQVVALAVDYAVWTPAVEELLFRGVLFLSLRQRLGPWTAAWLSAGVFAALHFYSLGGTLGALWSGLVWARLFERTGSLVPAALVHGAYNALFVAHHLAVYR